MAAALHPLGAGFGGPHGHIGPGGTLWEVATADGMREVIEPGAFSSVLGTGRDLLGLLDHDATQVLGRRRNNTLRLRENQEGLAFEIVLADTQLGRDTFVRVGREDLGGVSFGFAEANSVFDDVGGLRRWRMLDLYEVSLVSAFPTYTRTGVKLGPMGNERDFFAGVAGHAVVAAGAGE